jgi:hypothetical protein
MSSQATNEGPSLVRKITPFSYFDATTPLGSRLCNGHNQDATGHKLGQQVAVSSNNSLALVIHCSDGVVGSRRLMRNHLDAVSLRLELDW